MPRKDTTAQLLHTINHELKMKLEEVSRADNDLENLMSATAGAGRGARAAVRCAGPAWEGRPNP